MRLRMLFVFVYHQNARICSSSVLPPDQKKTETENDVCVCLSSELSPCRYWVATQVALSYLFCDTCHRNSQKDPWGNGNAPISESIMQFHIKQWRRWTQMLIIKRCLVKLPKIPTLFFFLFKFFFLYVTINLDFHKWILVCFSFFFYLCVFVEVGGVRVGVWGEGGFFCQNLSGHTALLCVSVSSHTSKSKANAHATHF